ncbi:glycosyltransferase family 2 protein [Ruminococcus sp.]|uniref:glycosyltransferase family 2 protein n=1 Tax=Ruminococcus sp. TaxID=41978 RepID=UPI0025D0E6E2|nr:glycosyltransferase family 2 protein [Ruminococcus sp.]
MEEQIKVSIIVPVYNIPEKALRDCLESTLKQTMKEIEVIVVDDGSTDKSGRICDEYAARDNRVKVIHKKNGGLSAARNTGYRVAKGEWITFLDSDDWIDPTTCMETYQLGMEKNVEVVIFGTIQEFEHYKNPFRYHFQDKQVFRNADCKTLQCEILDFTGNIATAWAKLIRKSVLEKYDIQHNEELRQGSEGIEFNIRLFEKIESAVFTDSIYYHYIYNPNSISAKHDEKNHYFVIKCFEEINRQINKSEQRQELKALFYNRFAYVVVAAAISGYFSPLNHEKYIEKKKSFKKYLDNQLVKKTLNKYEPSQVGRQRQMVLFFIKTKMWLPIRILAFIRYKQKH